MDSQDQPVFGYTFPQQQEHDILGVSSPNLTSSGPQLLTDFENQILAEFFTNTDPYTQTPDPLASGFHAPAETKNGYQDVDWGFVPPASVHEISTTIADQSQLTHGFHTERALPSAPLSASTYFNTTDEYQAASALFNNAQASHANARSYSVPNMHHGLPSSHAGPSDMSSSSYTNVPMVNTQHGPLNEQLASLLPHHSERGTVDELVASQFSQARRHHSTTIPESDRQRSSWRPSITYGTDSAFSSTRYIAPEAGMEDAIHQRLENDLRNARPIVVQDTNGNHTVDPNDPMAFVSSAFKREPSEEGEPSEDEQSSSDEADRPTKKRRKSKVTKPAKTPSPKRKSVSGRTTKPGKDPVVESNPRRKRPSTAGQRVQRENLSEEQKRSNHILSEQKRRNLIKRGFDDLHQLVPELRTGGLSKSGVLLTAGDFLEQLIQGNAALAARIGAT